MGTRDAFKDRVQQALDNCADFLTTYLPLANAHPTEFITNDIWDRLVPSHVQAQLLSLSPQELYVLPLNQHAESLCDLEKSLKCPSQTDVELNQIVTTLGDISIYQDCSVETVDRNIPKSIPSFCLEWNHSSLAEFLSAVCEHCLENLNVLHDISTSASHWLQERGGDGGDGGVPFVHAFMKVKKLHEVEIMADLCTRLFHKSSADLVVDIGSGKGYLSTHLSLQSGLPVVAIDSQPGNTTGAQQRSDKLAKQWPALVKHEQQKKVPIEQANRAAAAGHDGVQINPLGHATTGTVKSTGDNIHRGETPAMSGGVQENTKCDRDIGLAGHPGDINSGHAAVSGMETSVETKLSICDLHPVHVQNHPHNSPGASCASCIQSSPGAVASKENTCSHGDDVGDSAGSVVPLETRGVDVLRPDLAKASSTSGSKAFTLQSDSGVFKARCIPVTMFITWDTNLAEVVADEAPALCGKENVDSPHLLLTGLHTCGPLGANMLRLFVRDAAVKALCGVGCCYQLMQERFVVETNNGEDTHKMCGGEQADNHDFPLSSLLMARKMAIGRTALNVASLALPRMASTEGELQGATYYPRALLQSVLKAKMGHVPANLKRLRGLTKKAASPCDYIVKAVHKMNIPGCEVTQEEVATFHNQHSHNERKMAAFFQLRAALAPVVETVVLLDRLLYLMEQDCVSDAFLVRLFDPVTSPRCHAIIATKCS